MHRTKLLALLDRYQQQLPTGAGEASTVARFQRFASRQPRCFERDCWDDGHITSSALILNEDRSAMLMTLHAKLGKWLQLGGHADGETDPLAVACREAREESGLVVKPLSMDALDLDIYAFPAAGDDPPHYHYDVRFVLVAATAPLSLTRESLALKWVPFADLAAFTQEASILRLAAKAQPWRTV